MRRIGVMLLLLLSSVPSFAQRYDVGSPTLRDVFVDPVQGNDGNGGTSRNDALATLTEAWNRIPQGTVLTETGYHIRLLAGRYERSAIPNYLESRYGTAQCPIIIESADAPRSARLVGDLNIFDTRYLYVVGLDIVPEPAGDAYHCEKCDHILIRDSHLDGGNREAHDMTKINQSQYVYIEDSDLAGADDNTIDMVAVQYGAVTHNRISNAQDWCMYAKGGSAYLRIEGNEFFDCGTGGFTAGQGTGLQFMVAPWLHYEAYDIKVTNNVIHDTEGAGLGVNGGYDILLAYNTLYRVGSRDHMLEITFGNRSCDGNPGDPGREACQAYLDAGGWGTTVVDDGTNYVRIPSRNIYVYDNVLENPAGTSSDQAFSIAGPYSGSSQGGSHVVSPALVDTNLQIRGNVIHGARVLGIGDDTGCQPANPTCNSGQLLADNAFNAFDPQLGSDLRPTANSPLFTMHTFAIPDFSWSDVPGTEPQGTLTNRVTIDRDGVARASVSTPGAYAGVAAAATPHRRRSAPH